MTDISQQLPPPCAAAKAHSAKLAAVIADEIKQQGGIPFQRFMEMALYQPGLGYYSAGAHKFGAEGDFITAPMLSEAFSWCLAKQCQQLLQQDCSLILELGAGTGIMALTILTFLEQWHQLPEKYQILEVSADLRNRQQSLLQEKAPHLFNRVEWLNRLPNTAFNGIILANEVMDAMPVHKLCLGNNVQEYYVGLDNNHFTWELRPCQNAILREQIANMRLHQYLGKVDGYDTEINSRLPAWIHSLGDCLQHGYLLLIDYGYTRREYFHPQRHMGTLMCHYQHRAHDNALIFPGIQDITAHVDFTAVAEAGLAADLSVAGFTHQAAFLLNCGLSDYAHEHHCYETAQQIKRLTLPSEMGERFKVIALAKGNDEALLGFNQFDQTERL